MAFNIRVWFVPFGLHLASPILGSSLSLLTITTPPPSPLPFTSGSGTGPFGPEGGGEVSGE